MTVADALKAVGLTVHDHRVAPRPGSWAPVAVLWHHVGNVPPGALRIPAPSISLCQHGRADLTGPLCQWLVDGDGGWNWITDGRANHAGAGDLDVWQWLIADPQRRPPNPPRPDDNRDKTDGNGHLVGVEVEGNGNWTAKVYASLITGTRAILAFEKLPQDNLLAHKEWTTRKIDPTGIDMAAARNQLRTPNPVGDDDMPKYVYSIEGHPEKGEYVTDGLTTRTLSQAALIDGKNRGWYVDANPKEMHADEHNWLVENTKGNNIP